MNECVCVRACMCVFVCVKRERKSPWQEVTLFILRELQKGNTLLYLSYISVVYFWKCMAHQNMESRGRSRV